MSTNNSFSTEKDLFVDGAPVRVHSLPALEQAGFPRVARLPYSLKILLENLLRREDGALRRRADDIAALAAWDPAPPANARRSPSRRRACCCRTSPACRPSSISPRCATASCASAATPRGSTRCSRSSSSSTTRCRSTTSARPDAFELNAELEFTPQPRALHVPALGPERVLATSASSRPTPASSTRSTSSTSRAWSSATTADGRLPAYPDTLVGTDSHTTMVNGLGVVGWGVGGIEAEAAHARPADLDADPRGARLPADRPAAGGRDGDRPRADDHRAAAQARRRRQVRRVLRPGPRVT